MTKRTLSITIVLAVVLTACGGASDQGATDTGTAPPNGVHTDDTELGSILVNADGFALYVLTADSEGESTCYDQCAELWPPIEADTPVTADLDQTMFGSTTRADNTEQLTVNGQPLYAYTSDTNPGETSGQGVNDVWFVVGSDGAVIGSASGVDTTTGDGYNY